MEISIFAQGNRILWCWKHQECGWESPEKLGAIVHLGAGRDDLPGSVNTVLFYLWCDGRTQMMFLANPLVYWASLVTQWYRICLPMQERQKRCRFGLWVGKIPWRRAWQPTLVFLPGEFHEQRSLVGCSPWGWKELDSIEMSRDNLRCADDTTLMAESKEELQRFLMEVRGEWKRWLKAQHSEN